MCAILVAIFLVKYGLGTMAWLEANSLASSNTWVADVPQPLAQSPEPTGKIDQIKLYNFQFNSPWPGKYKTEEHLTHTIVRFDSGQVLVFYDPDTQKDTIGTLKTADPANYQKFAAVFSGAPIESNYSLYQQVYGAAPSLLSPHERCRRTARTHAADLEAGFRSRPESRRRIPLLRLGHGEGFSVWRPGECAPRRVARVRRPQPAISLPIYRERWIERSDNTGPDRFGGALVEACSLPRSVTEPG
jgi:hypothetical protein